MKHSIILTASLDKLFRGSKLFCALCACLMGLFVACHHDDDPEPVNPSVPSSQTTGLYILNRGNWGENNASLSFYNLLTGTMTVDVYKQANGGSGLGDSAEQLLIYGAKMYISVTMSNRLVVLDLDGKLIASIEPTEGDNTMNPRGLAAANGKVYVTYYYGHALAALDTATLEITAVTPVGRYPEKVAFANWKLFVANSGGPDYPDYGQTVSVVDAATMTVEKEIDVVINPVQALSDSRGNIYVVSMGNYGDIPTMLQRIDAASHAVSVMGEATAIAIAGDTLYAMSASYGASTVTYKRYNLLNGDVCDIITDGTSIPSPSVLAADPLTGKIYIATFDYGSIGSLYIFAADGTLQQIVDDIGGYDPQSIAFVANK